MTPDADELLTCVETSAKISADTADKILDNIGRKAKRAGDFVLNCGTSETCYAEKDGNLFCLNKSTGMSRARQFNQDEENANLHSGDYTDISGGKGNAKTGSYTSATASTPTATVANKAASQSTAPASSATNSATTNAGSENFRIDAVVGMVGLVVGLVM